MFESISDNLFQLAYFTILGFFLAAFYEPLRIIRLFKRQKTLLVGIQDFVFLSLVAIITFAYSMELGNGNFRLFFIAGELFGAVIYFLTIGRFISMISNLIVWGIKKFLYLIKKYIISPILSIVTKLYKFIKRKFITLYSFIIKKFQTSSNGLKKNVHIVYNKYKPRTKNKSGETKNVIKAKIRAEVQKKA